jgi:hypothetical protein
MTTVHINQLLTSMQSGASLDEALQRYNLTQEDLTEDTHKELQRQMEIHNKAVEKEEQTVNREATRIEESLNENSELR